MNIEELTPEALKAYSTKGNFPHEIQMRELGLNYSDLPREIQSEIRAVELSFRNAKKEDAIIANIKRSVVVADWIITFAESNRPDAPTGPTPEEIEAKRLEEENKLKEQEEKRLAEEQKRLDEEQQQKEQARLAEIEAKKKAKSFGNDYLDTITGNW